MYEVQYFSDAGSWFNYSTHDTREEAMDAAARLRELFPKLLVEVH